ncbi:MAG: archaellin/type IV pilin N-terminal domain-containing protein [Thermoplasmata archaeon]
MATRLREALDGTDDNSAISSEVAVVVLTLITVVLAVLVYVFATTFLFL